MTALLDNPRVGVLHLDRRGRIIEANGRARNILRHGDGLADRDGTLRARTRGLTGTRSAARPAESTPMLAFRFEVQGLAPTVADDSRCHAAADRA